MQEKELPVAGGSLRYVIQSTSVCITGWPGQAGEVTVPEQIEGLPVAVIG